jgi:hypothetical protein
MFSTSIATSAPRNFMLQLTFKTTNLDISKQSKSNIIIIKLFLEYISANYVIKATIEDISLHNTAKKFMM